MLLLVMSMLTAAQLYSFGLISETASTPRLASHKAGAAADILLRDIKTGLMLDFDHQYSDGEVFVSLHNCGSRV